MLRIFVISPGYRRLPYARRYNSCCLFFVRFDPFAYCSQIVDLAARSRSYVSAQTALRAVLFLRKATTAMTADSGVLGLTVTTMSAAKLFLSK